MVEDVSKGTCGGSRSRGVRWARYCLAGGKHRGEGRQEGPEVVNHGMLYWGLRSRCCHEADPVVPSRCSQFGPTASIKPMSTDLEGDWVRCRLFSFWVKLFCGIVCDAVISYLASTTTILYQTVAGCCAPSFFWSRLIYLINICYYQLWK